MREIVIQQAIRLALGQEPDVRVWRNECGVAVHRGRHVRYGLVRGSSDLILILKPLGRFLALEVKLPKGRISVEQEQFLEVVRRFGGFGAVVRSVEDARAALDRARRGESE
jgi:hypothetical protein